MSAGQCPACGWMIWSCDHYCSHCGKDLFAGLTWDDWGPREIGGLTTPTSLHEDATTGHLLDTDREALV